MPEVIEILYDGFVKYEKGIKGYFVVPSLATIKEWEEWRALILDQLEQKKTKIIPTVLLLKSLGMARYIMRNVDNVYIPDSLIERIGQSPDKVRECTLIASEMVTLLKKEGFSGANIATLGWEHKLPEIIEKI